MMLPEESSSSKSSTQTQVSSAFGHMTAPTPRSKAPAQDGKFFPSEHRCIFLIPSWLRNPPGEFMPFGLRVTAAVNVCFAEKSSLMVLQLATASLLEHCKVT